MKMMPVLLLVLLMIVSGCGLPRRGDGLLPAASDRLAEPDWIRNGEPLVFEAAEWFPTDEVENLLPAEVFEVGVFRGVPYYIEKTDVRPFDRLYTYFSPNRYRAFEQ